MRKGQYFSFDAIVASVIFILALMSLLSYWHSVRTYLDYQNNDIQKDAIRVSNLLFAPPYPESSFSSATDCDDVERLGFSNAWDNQTVSRAVLIGAETCADDNQEWLKSKLATPYNLSIHVSYLSSDLDDQFIGGEVPDVPLREVVSMRRLATVSLDDGETYAAVIDVSLYR